MLRAFFQNLVMVLATLACAGAVAGAVFAVIFSGVGLVTWLGPVAGMAIWLLLVITGIALAITLDDRRRR